MRGITENYHHGPEYRGQLATPSGHQSIDMVYEGGYSIEELIHDEDKRGRRPC